MLTVPSGGLTLYENDNVLICLTVFEAQQLYLCPVCDPESVPYNESHITSLLKQGTGSVEALKLFLDSECVILLTFSQFRDKIISFRAVQKWTERDFCLLMSCGLCPLVKAFLICNVELLTCILGTVEA